MPGTRLRETSHLSCPGWFAYKQTVLTDTLNKFVLVIGLFAVFLVLVNVFAARHHIANRRAGSFRRHRRRRSSRPVPPMDDAQGGEAGRVPSMDDAQDREAGRTPPDESDLVSADAEPGLLRRMAPQLLISTIALAICGLALFIMWHVASRS